MGAGSSPAVVIISGPSGSGKTTIVQRLLAAPSLKLVKSVSATTRAPRKGEIPGDDYHFLSREEFEQKRQQGEFVECFEVHSTGNWYGTPTSELTRAAEQNAWALLEIDVQGAKRILEQYPQAVTIFLRASSRDEYEKRLRARNTDPHDVIQKRLETAETELACAGWYQHQVINDNLDDAVQRIVQILKNNEQGKNA